MDFENLLVSSSSSPIKIIAPQIDFEAYVSIDLSAAHLLLNDVDVQSSDSLAVYINNYLKSRSKQVAYGGYLELRSLYTRSHHFHQHKENQRNIHLGIDLWCKAKTPVLAAFDGTIHSFKNNVAFGDYGPTIILEHCIDEMSFFTLYGHLSLDSIAHLEVGVEVKANEIIGHLGTAEVNGDYPPHLHFQIIKDLQGNFGDYPGVCSIDDLDFYKENCPDPNLILKLK
ncbi:MAG: peptidoglycan DD-metalloendopeptidase family protein [Flavobacteriaceae bacterium]